MSPQQLQKYEAADNRITAGRLFTCAIALDVPVSFFFDGLTDGRDDSTADPRASSSSARAGQVSVDEVGELLRLYSSIVDHDIRRRAIEYIRSLVPGAKKIYKHSGSPVRSRPLHSLGGLRNVIAE